MLRAIVSVFAILSEFTALISDRYIQQRRKSAIALCLDFLFRLKIPVIRLKSKSAIWKSSGYGGLNRRGKRSTNSSCAPGLLLALDVVSRLGMS